ncbi:CRISPR-associated protein Cas4 [Oceanobacillus jeddahense]|uniref:CRISPR-associated protein Cas4 n=1 Tax=Oceanobacillus jeddahense TaxID=1462527 RepID=UPI0005961A1B|nr:CRISPR-associated protein Cas4 [Oceanobacillus jeddahense]
MEDYLLLSGLQHFQFCKRQWALIHIEQQWEENVKTVEGHYLHKKADTPSIKEKRGNKIIVRAMPIHSHELKITGVCDVVEFIEDENGVDIVGHSGKYKAFPIEYKRGKPKKGKEDIVQLVAQAICLEEMHLINIDKGYFFYHEIRKRVEVSITEDLKKYVKELTDEMHHYYQKKHTPKVKTGPHCRSCSLKNICLPSLMNKITVQQYLERNLYG